MNNDISPLDKALDVQRLELEREKRKEVNKGRIAVGICAVSAIGGGMLPDPYLKLLCLSVGLMTLCKMAASGKE